MKSEVSTEDLGVWETFKGTEPESGAKGIERNFRKGLDKEKTV